MNKDNSKSFSASLEPQLELKITKVFKLQKGVFDMAADDV